MLGFYGYKVIDLPNHPLISVIEMQSSEPPDESINEIIPLSDSEN